MHYEVELAVVIEAVQTPYESGQQEWVRVAAVAKVLGIDRSVVSRRLVRPVAGVARVGRDWKAHTRIVDELF